MTEGAPVPAVVGAALYASPSEAHTFLRSFEAKRKDARLYLLVDRADIAAWLPIRSASVELVPIRRPWLLRAPLGLAEYRMRRILSGFGFGHAVRALDRALIALGRRPLGPLLEQPHVARLWHQAGLIEQALGRAPWVFVTDVRDVAFQADFESAFGDLVAGAPLHVFAEGVNLGDVGDLAGAPQIRQLGRTLPPGEARPVLCVGTILGTSPAVSTLLKRLLAVTSLPFARHPRTTDQGALNLVVHSGEADDLSLVIHPPGEGGVLTCALLEGRPELLVTSDGVWWSSTFPPVVHQFDRVAGLETVYESSFG